ncbi:MAG: nickel pincer cofactor biosynthesis protein LarC [Candidatus Omnitrophota bacterium]
MRIAYLDCFSGISGDMTVAAFLDAGLKLSVLKKRLSLLNLKGYSLSAFKKNCHGIAGTKFEVHISDKRHLKRSTYKEIKNIINKSKLDIKTKSIALSIFETLAKAEAKVHNKPKAGIHFHEVGDLDSIIDIVSTAIAANEFGIEKFYCLNLKAGKGNVLTRHGNFPLPAPATLQMLKGKPVSFSDIEYELITPTGAAILTTLVKDFDSKPKIDIRALGYGAGSYEIELQPDVLRLIIGDSGKEALPQDKIVVIETNIDDMSPVYYEYLMDKLFKMGALDVYLTNVYMKKSRPGVLLTVLAKEGLLDELAKTIMKEATTSGVRYYSANRKILDRVTKTIKTKYGPVRVKVNFGPDGIKTISPEYEDCKKIAEKTSIPLKTVFNEARKKSS